MNCYDGLLALLGNHAQLYYSTLEVKHSVPAAALTENNLVSSVFGQSWLGTRLFEQRDGSDGTT
jgi:hypothetical protein